MDYYPFGSVRLNQLSGAFNEPKKFTGKELDKETGLYYYGARYYDGRAGRFISIDPLINDIGIGRNKFKQKYDKEIIDVLSNPQELNSYSYVTNNPLKYNDPTGESGLSTVISTLGKGFSKITGPLAIISYAYDLLKPCPAGRNLSNGQSYADRTVVLDNFNSEKTNIGISGAAVAGVTRQSGIQIGSKIQGFGEVIANTPGEINGFMREGVPNPFHGLDQAITRGVSPSEILNTVKNPLITFKQGNGNIYRLTQEAAVVLNQAGKVVTTYGKSEFFPKVVQLLTKIIK